MEVYDLGDGFIRTTTEHPFYVRGKGWTKAWLLCDGDQFRSHDGQSIPLDYLCGTEKEGTVYNLRIADYHTYFVGKPDGDSRFGRITHTPARAETIPPQASASGCIRSTAGLWRNSGSGHGSFCLAARSRNAVNVAKHIVRELKPDNARAIARGFRQAEAYAGSCRISTLGNGA